MRVDAQRPSGPATGSVSPFSAAVARSARSEKGYCCERNGRIKRAERDSTSTLQDAVDWAFDVAKAIEWLIDRKHRDDKCFAISGDLLSLWFTFSELGLHDHEQAFIEANIQFLRPHLTGTLSAVCAFGAAQHHLLKLFATGNDGMQLLWDHVTKGSKINDADWEQVREAVAQGIEDMGEEFLCNFACELKCEAIRAQAHSQRIGDRINVIPLKQLSVQDPIDNEAIDFYSYSVGSIIKEIQENGQPCQSHLWNLQLALTCPTGNDDGAVFENMRYHARSALAMLAARYEMDADRLLSEANSQPEGIYWHLLFAKVVAEAPAAHKTSQSAPSSTEPASTQSRRWTCEEAEPVVARFLAGKPCAAIREVSEATGVSRGTIGKTRSWRRAQSSKQANRSARPKAVALTDELLNAVPDETPRPDVLAYLIGSQEVDFEPSPLDEAGRSPRINRQV